MTVMLKPHLWVNHGFTRQFELKLMLNGQNGKPIMIHSGLSISTIRKMELFCFGTELGNAIAKRPQYWSQLIVKIRKYIPEN
jgi:hypothetical protein